MNNSDTWHRFGMNGNPEVSVGDRAVLPLFLSSGPATDPPVYFVSCTGAFIIEDGQVQSRDSGPEFKEDGVYSMTGGNWSGVAG